MLSRLFPQGNIKTFFRKEVGQGFANSGLDFTKSIKFYFLRYFGLFYDKDKYLKFASLLTGTFCNNQV